MALLAPLHGGDVGWMRTLGLLVGLWALFVSHRLASRLADTLSADLAVLAMASMTAFTVAHSLLVYYGLLPTAAAHHRRSGAVAAAARAGGGGTTLHLARGDRGRPGRPLAPDDPLTLLLRVPVRRAARARAPRVAAPPHGRCHGRVAGGRRPARRPDHFVARRREPRGVGPAPRYDSRWSKRTSSQGASCARSSTCSCTWSDIRIYGDLAAGSEPRVGWAGALVGAASLAYGSVQLARVLRHGAGQWLAAGCAALLWTWLGVSVLL